MSGAKVDISRDAVVKLVERTEQNYCSCDGGFMRRGLQDPACESCSTEDERHEICAMLRALSAEVERLEREKEALRVDAERYRWLRDDSMYAGPVNGEMTWPVHGKDCDHAIPCYGEELDAAIDAAIAARGRG